MSLHLSEERCAHGGSMCTDCDAQGRCVAEFEDSRRAALDAADDARREQRQIDRLVNWLFMTAVVAVVVWAVYW